MAGLNQSINHRLRFLFIIFVIAVSVPVWSCTGSEADNSTLVSTEEATIVKLSEPRYESEVSLEESLLLRRSVRSYTEDPLSLSELSQLLWAAQGITHPAGFRTAPSAGGLYPLDTYVLVGNVENLSPAIYKYQPDGHQLVKSVDGDRRPELAKAALDQEWVLEGAVSFIFIGVYQRTTEKYGERGVRYVHLEAGHAAQNLCLQAVALGLGSVPVGAFHDDRIASILGLSENEQPLYIIPVGKQQS